MEKQTLTNYGWITIVTLILALMIAFATPFGKFVGTGARGIVQGMIREANEMLSEENRDKAEEEWSGKLNYSVFEGQFHKITHLGVAENATYYIGISQTTPSDYSAATTTHTFGDVIPTPQQGDVYVFEDYEYRYNMQYDAEQGQWIVNTQQDGWGVYYTGHSKKPTIVLTQIGQKNVTNFTNAFCGNIDIEVAPEIPETILYTTNAFKNCTMLEDVHRCIIPQGVINIDGTFLACSSLKGPIIIQGTPTSYRNVIVGTAVKEIIGNCPDSIKEEILANTKLI